MSSNGEKYAHKCLPIILKNYRSKIMPYIIFYSNDEFAILSIYELYELLPLCNNLAKERLKSIFDNG